MAQSNSLDRQVQSQAASGLDSRTKVEIEGKVSGLPKIPSGTPLVRLNYFDGLFLRASHLEAEQRYLRALTAFANQGLGPGIVRGFGTKWNQADDTLTIGGGLAFDNDGRTLLLPGPVTVGIAELIDKSRDQAQSQPGGLLVGEFGVCAVTAEAGEVVAPTESGSLFLLAICHLEALCGQEDVYGRLCEKACVTDSDRPWRVEGVVVRAVPLSLKSAPLYSDVVTLGGDEYLRANAAHRYFEDERLSHPHSICGAGLRSGPWCLGAEGEQRDCKVPLGVLGRVGATTLFFDPWIARRERMETPARRYWDWRMAMRPWDVFLAQVLQFQCQLAQALRPGLEWPRDPCLKERGALSEGIATLAEAIRTVAQSDRQLNQKLSELHSKFTDLLKQPGSTVSAATQRRLIQLGIPELPPAGYLPVEAGKEVNSQVRAWMGEGVDLRFCIVRPDYVGHALEEAQHLERISLVDGLARADGRPKVDILVPNGTVAPDRVEQGRFYEMQLAISQQALEALATSMLREASGARLSTAATPGPQVDATGKVNAFVPGGWVLPPAFLEHSGAARSEDKPSGGATFYFAGVTGTAQAGGLQLLPAEAGQLKVAEPAAGAKQVRVGQPVLMSAASSPLLNANVGRLLAQTPERATGQRETRSELWACLEVDADPATLSRGQSTRADADLYVLATVVGQAEQPRPTPATNAAGPSTPGEEPPTLRVTTLVHMTFVGELLVERVDVRADGQRTLEAVLSGQLNLALTSSVLGERSASRYVSESVTMVRVLEDHGPRWTIRMTAPDFLPSGVAALKVMRAWTGPTTAETAGLALGTSTPEKQAAAAANAPATETGAASPQGKVATPSKSVEGGLRQAGAEEAMVVFGSSQKTNADVYQPNHVAHVAAIRALRDIGEALGSGRFADLTAARLFPPQAPSSSEQTVLAGLDWVFFHRRRSISCRQDKPQTSVPARQYAVYQVALSANVGSVETVAAMLQQGEDAIKALGLRFVQVVDFGAGIHAVQTPHAQVQATWSQCVGADAGTIKGAVIASGSAAAAEGDALAQDRAEALVDVVANDAGIDPQPTYVALQSVPPFLDAATTDGAIVVATQKTVATVCHEVRTIPYRRTLEVLRRALGDMQAGQTVDALLKQAQATDLEKAQFYLGSDQPVTGSLETVKAKWPTGYSPDGALVIWAKIDPAAPDSYALQSAKIVSALGSTEAPSQVAVSGELPGECMAITIVALGTQVQPPVTGGTVGLVARVASIYKPETSDATPRLLRSIVPSFDASGTLRGNAMGDAKQWAKTLGAKQRVTRVSLATRGAPDASAQARANAVLKALREANVADDSTQVEVVAMNTLDAKLKQARSEVGEQEDLIVLSTDDK